MRHKILLVAALAVAVTACGGGGGGGETVAVVASPAGLTAAASQTAAAKTGHVAMSIGTGANGQAARTIASGAYDAENHLSSMSMDMSSLISSPGVKVEVVSTADTLYLHFPFFADLLGVTTEWMSLEAGADASSFEVADPSAFLDFLRGAGGEVTTVGRENIRGVDTTHLHGTVRLRDALNSAPAGERERLQRAMNQLNQRGETLLDADLPVDVFIDDSGMVRRLSFEFESPELAMVEPERTVITIDLFEFGTDVSISAPPSDQVTDVTAEFEQLSDSLGGG